VEEPLFRSYVFVRVNSLDHLDVVQTPGAVAIVRWLSKPAIIRDEEIQAIKEFLSLSNGLEVEIRDFKKGDKLRVKYGNLENTTGTVIRQTKQKVILEIEKLGIALYAEVPKSQVENLN
jgi:transcription antitermination factor NusG